MKLYRTRVLERERIGGHVLLRYEWSGSEPEPGQFVGVKAEDTSNPFLPRPFFVHDTGEREISLVFKVRGPGTRAILDGGHVLVSAPRGRGFDLGDSHGADAAGGHPDSRRALLVGGGVWVAPLKLLSRRLGERGVAHDVFLEAPPEATEGYVSWLKAAYPGAEILPTDGSDGAFVDALGGLDSYGAVYVSGGRDILRRVRREREDAQLAVRERMACMDGSCYGCVVPVLSGGASYKRVCVEGPVFRAGELDW
ncbi:dihydroorotate oxidase B electron transfer subunit [soil metagenome]